MKFKDCIVEFENDILTIGNSKIKREYQWNNGNLITLSITNRETNSKIYDNTGQPDFLIPGSENITAQQGTLDCRIIEENAVTTDFLEVETIFLLGKLWVKRISRIYPDCPVIACVYYLKGADAAGLDTAPDHQNKALTNIENAELLDDSPAGQAIMEKICLSPATHHKVCSIQFHDVTDRCNNLVEELNVLPYRTPLELNGQLIMVSDSLSDQQFFILKEAPCSDIQLNCPAPNFQLCREWIKLTGPGLAGKDISDSTWSRSYGFATGLVAGSEDELLMVLHHYLKCRRRHLPDRDEMIMLNTWGDRSQDSRLNESFALCELEAGARLGVSHFQLDDGWQQGISSNSALGTGSLDKIWENSNYWSVNAEKFPRGLSPIKSKADELGIELCLWFNPAKDNSYENWEKDADTLIGLFRNYGIRTFKIDGVDIPDRLAEKNLRQMLDKVMQATDYNAVFNLDVTAGQRFGYHYFNEYGNKFLENRYTDWSNYYPHWTLRNLWMLAKYVPSPSLQMEFLNKWRNRDNYPAADPLAPYNIPFDYCFAVTMMAQPLAWFEASGLPEEAFSIAPLITVYRQHMARIHQGIVLPIGSEPNGFSWTGFQSVLSSSEGYLCIYREYNVENQSKFKLRTLKDCTLNLEHLAGHARSGKIKVDAAGNAEFSLPEKFTFALFRYN